MNHLLLPSKLAWLDKNHVAQAIRQLDPDAELVYASNKLDETLETVEDLDDDDLMIWVIPPPQTQLVFSSCIVGRGIHDTLEGLDVYSQKVILPNGVFRVETITVNSQHDYKKYGRLHLQELRASDKFGAAVGQLVLQQHMEVMSATTIRRRQLLLLAS